MKKPRQTVGPAESPVSLADFKLAQRVDYDDEDTIVQGYLDAATAHFDGWQGVLGRPLVTQTWSYGFSCWSRRLPIAMPNTQSVTVTYRDSEDQEQTVAPSEYELVAESGGDALVFHDFSAPQLFDDAEYPITVTAVQGFGAAIDVPQPIKAAIMLLAGHWYEHREAVTLGETSAPLALGVDALTAPYKWRHV